MKLIGITGPTGAGKTTALKAFERRGALVVDCDAVYHTLLCTCQPMKAELKARFGETVFGPDGQLDRKALGAVVYGDQAAMKDLETITHRYVAAEVDRLLEQGREERRPAVAVDAIALLEGDLAARCDAVIGILAPEQQRLQRIMAREGVSEAYARARIRAQKDDGFYRENCTYILENNGTEAAFASAAGTLFDKLLEDSDCREDSLAGQKENPDV